tara:strand:+ start:662 stop:3184 length:2523 start_codon:yes stop_codon:yes gene_type:complete
MLGLLTFTSTAQVTYDSSHFFQAGDSLLYSKFTVTVDSFNFDSTGSGMTWDYSDLTFSNQVTHNYFDPNTSGYKNNWCLSNGYVMSCQAHFDQLTNVARISFDSLNTSIISVQNTTNHYKLSGGAYENAMLGMTIVFGNIPFTITSEFEDKDSIYQFPLTYNQADSSTSRLVLDFNSYGIPVKQSRNAIRRNTVEGWGTLITPYDTFNSVLKMRTIVERFDTLFIDTNVVPTHTFQVEYKWFDPNHAGAVLQAKGSIAGNQEVITEVLFKDTVQCVPPQALYAYQPFVVYYDSATQSSTVNFTNLSNNADSLTWFFGDSTASSHVNNPSHTYYCPGTYFSRLVAINSCNPNVADTMILPVYVLDTNSSSLPDTINTAICYGDSVLINGNYVDQPGYYVENAQNTSGCDSISVIHLTLYPYDSIPDTSLVSICPGDSLLIDGNYETNPGLYSELYTSIYGCDSLHMVELSFYPYNAVPDTSSVTICMGDSALIGGNYETNPGLYTELYTSIYGCDSLHMVELSFYPYNTVPDTSSVTICMGDSALIGGNYETNPGVYTELYTSIYGCDSLHMVELSFYPFDSVPDTSFVSICMGDSALIGGNYETNPGVYTELYTSTYGCDSLHMVELSFYPFDSIPDTSFVSLCPGDSVLIDGSYISTAGTYPINLTSNYGCDSSAVIVVELTTIDTTVTLSAGTLTAQQTGAVYQWLACPDYLPISGETNNSYTPNATGTYAVEFSFNGCADTSGCHTVVVTGMDDLNASNELKVYPNPFTNQLTVDLQNNATIQKIELYTIRGQVVCEQLFPGNFSVTFTIPELPKGIYLLRITTTTGEAYYSKLTHE